MDSIIAYEGLFFTEYTGFLFHDGGSTSGVPAWRWQIVLGRKTGFCTLDTVYLFCMHRRYEIRPKAI